MKDRVLSIGFLVVVVVALVFAGQAWAMGKKPKAVEKEKQLGKAGTMMKSYDPETGVKRMEKTIGHGEKTMTLEKGRKEGATVERSWKTGPEVEIDSSTQGQGKGKGKNK
jgi:hypothetical protein